MTEQIPVYVVQGNRALDYASTDFIEAVKAYKRLIQIYKWSWVKVIRKINNEPNTIEMRSFFERQDTAIITIYMMNGHEMITFNDDQKAYLNQMLDTVASELNLETLP